MMRGIEDKAPEITEAEKERALKALRGEEFDLDDSKAESSEVDEPETEEELEEEEESNEENLDENLDEEEADEDANEDRDEEGYEETHEEGSNAQAKKETGNDTEKENREEQEVLKTVPLQTHIDERQKYKTRIKELEAKEKLLNKLSATMEIPEGELEDRIFNVSVQKMMDKYEGMTEEEARAKIKESQESSDLKKEVMQYRTKAKIKELAKDAVYADIEEYEDDILEIATSKGLELEDAYWLVAGKNKFSKKAETSQRKKQINNKVKKAQNFKQTGSNMKSATKKEGMKLSKDQREFLKETGADASIYGKSSKLNTASYKDTSSLFGIK